MSYYCENCKKEHSEKYKVHLRYKRSELVEACEMVEDLAESEPQAFVNSHLMIEMEERIAELEKTQETIIGILIHWKLFIDRKHPYAHIYQVLFDDLRI